MSLATQQRILQIRSDRDDLLRRISVGEDTPRVRQLLTQATNNISRFEKQYQIELAEANTKKANGEAKKVHQPRESSHLPADLELSCVDCASFFTFTGKDQVFFIKNNYKVPIRCTICRDTKKNTKPEGKDIECSGCKKKFFFSDAKAAIFEDKGWAAPKWCPTCKTAKK